MNQQGTAVPPHSRTEGAPEQASQASRASGYRKATLRIIPFLFICYFFAFLDRVNVGFAKLQMLSDLGLSEAVYGLGAGIFFIGYFIFEVPSNLILHRVGARVWLARIMVSWGLISGLMIFVSSPTSFYTLRFLLGVAEAGFFPGIILYLTYWYPAKRRGQITALFMAAIPVSGLIGSPISGLILDYTHNAFGLAGWQWLFIIEAIPSCILGIVLFCYLTDKPDQAKWLTRDEAACIAADLRDEAKMHDTQSAGDAMRDLRVWLLALIYFGIQMGVYGIGFWLPTIVKHAGFASDTATGFVTAIPYLGATIFMIFMGRSADATGKRRLHVTLPAILGCIGLIGAGLFATQTTLAIFFLTLATMGAITALTLFWSLPSAFLGGFAAAGGIAIINSVGNLAGFASPYLVGLIKQATHSTNPALYMMAAALLIAAILATRVSRDVDR